jgi:hypothetical protein
MPPLQSKLKADAFHCHEHHRPSISMHIPNARASTSWVW